MHVHLFADVDHRDRYGLLLSCCGDLFLSFTHKYTRTHTHTHTRVLSLFFFNCHMKRENSRVKSRIEVRQEMPQERVVRSMQYQREQGLFVVVGYIYSD